MSGRILGIDFGLRRLGVAISDPLGLTAQGLETLDQSNAGARMAALTKLINEYGVQEVVIGNPLSATGEPTTMSRRADKFAEDLRRRLPCSVKLWDERLSSAEANRLLRSSGASIIKRLRAVDRVAASLILQNYLDWRAFEKRDHPQDSAR